MRKIKHTLMTILIWSMYFLITLDTENHVSHCHHFMSVVVGLHRTLRTSFLKKKLVNWKQTEWSALDLFQYSTCQPETIIQFDWLRPKALLFKNYSVVFEILYGVNVPWVVLYKVRYFCADREIQDGHHRST